jgi:hypothetical protein
LSMNGRQTYCLWPDPEPCAMVVSAIERACFVRINVTLGL